MTGPKIYRDTAASYENILHNPLMGYPGVLCDCNREWEEILPMAVPRFYRKGDFITFAGKRKHNFSYLKNGFLCCVYSTPSGASRTTMFMLGGTIFHEAQTVSYGVDENNMFLCKTDCQCYEFEGSILYDRNFVMQYPHLMINIVSSFGEKIIKHSNILNAICMFDKFTLVCWYILSMARVHGGYSFNPKISQTDIMNLLGVKKTTMHRIVNTLKRDGVIERFTKNLIIIKDVEKLERLAISSEKDVAG